jgi:hypothetical protein
VVVLLAVGLISMIAFAVVAGVEEFGTEDSPAQLSNGFADASKALGLISAVAWVVAEGLNTVPFTKAWLRQPTDSLKLTDYLSWEKSVLQIVGALLLFSYIAYTLSPAGKVKRSIEAGVIQPPPSVGDAIWTAVFVAGTVLAALGTIRGIINGVLSQLEKNTQVPRQRSVEVQTDNPMTERRLRASSRSRSLSESSVAEDTGASVGLPPP